MVAALLMLLLVVEPLKWQARHVKEIVPGCGDRKNGCAHAEVTTVDVISGPAAVRNAINEVLHGKTGTTGEVREFLAGFRKARNEDPEPQRHWYSTAVDEVMLSRPGVFSTRTYAVIYEGGAHGNAWTIYHNFDPATGEELAWEDLLKDQGALAKLTEIAARHFAMDAGTDQEFWMTDDFGLGKRGLIFSWNQFDFGYRAGTATIEIPYAEIKELFKPGILP
jgi:hypothetical protein